MFVSENNDYLTVHRANNIFIRSIIILKYFATRTRRSRFVDDFDRFRRHDVKLHKTVGENIFVKTRLE